MTMKHAMMTAKEANYGGAATQQANREREELDALVARVETEYDITKISGVIRFVNKTDDSDWAKAYALFPNSRCPSVAWIEVSEKNVYDVPCSLPAEAFLEYTKRDLYDFWRKAINKADAAARESEDAMKEEDERACAHLLGGYSSGLLGDY